MVHDWRHSFDSPISELDLKTAQLPALLEEPRKDLQVLQSQFDGTTSLVRNMPAEILQEIFSAYLQLSPETSAFDTMKGPWVLCRICSKWSTVMYSCSALWTVSDIGVDSWKAYRLRDPLALLKCFLERTGSTRDIRLSITSFFDLHYYFRSFPTKELLGVLTNISPRWRDVKFSRFSFIALSPLSVIRGRLQRLRSLVFMAGRQDAGLPAHISLFDTAHVLEELQFSGLQLVQFQLPTYSQLRAVTDLTFRTIRDSPLQALDILRECPNLRSLATDPGHYGGSSWHIAERATHSTLASLTTSDIDLLDALILPNLVKLEIISPTDMPSEDMDLVDALSRVMILLRFSKCALQILKLTNCRLTVDDVDLYLPLIPDLLELRIHYTLPLEQYLPEPGLAMIRLVRLLHAKTDDVNLADNDPASSSDSGGSEAAGASLGSDAEDAKLSDQNFDFEGGSETVEESEAAKTQAVDNAPSDNFMASRESLALPKLTAFYYSDLGSSELLQFVGTHFVNMLRFRQRYGAGFKKVRIEFNSRTPATVVGMPWTVNELRKLKSEGLDISIFRTEPALILV